MVGTALTIVARARRTSGQKADAEKRSGTISVAPASSVASVEKTNPCTWNSGITHSETSRGSMWYQRTMLRADVVRLAWVSGTPLGWLVVPLVCRNSATSS